jgi:hypothetical protein
MKGTAWAGPAWWQLVLLHKTIHLWRKIILNIFFMSCDALTSDIIHVY